MKRILPALLASIIVLAAIFLIWNHLRNRDERAVRKTLADLQEMVSKFPGEAPAASALKFARPERIFAPRVRIVSREPVRNMNMTDKECAVQISVSRRFFTSLHLNCKLETLLIDGKNASGSCELHISGTTSSRSEKIDEVRIADIRWQKNGDRWQICDVEVKPLLVK